MSRDQNAGQNHNTETGNNTFDRVVQVKYLGTNLTNQNSMHQEITSRLKPENACYHSAQNLLSSSLLCKNIKIETYRKTILPLVLYGCQNWTLSLRESCWLRVFENRVLRKTFEPKDNII